MYQKVSKPRKYQSIVNELSHILSLEAIGYLKIYYRLNLDFRLIHVFLMVDTLKVNIFRTAVAVGPKKCQRHNELGLLSKDYHLQAFSNDRHYLCLFSNCLFR